MNADELREIFIAIDSHSNFELLEKIDIKRT